MRGREKGLFLLVKVMVFLVLTSHSPSKLVTDLQNLNSIIAYHLGMFHDQHES